MRFNQTEQASPKPCTNTLHPHSAAHGARYERERAIIDCMHSNVLGAAHCRTKKENRILVTRSLLSSSPSLITNRTEQSWYRVARTKLQSCSTFPQGSLHKSLSTTRQSRKSVGWTEPARSWPPEAGTRLSSTGTHGNLHPFRPSTFRNGSMLWTVFSLYWLQPLPIVIWSSTTLTTLQLPSSP